MGFHGAWAMAIGGMIGGGIFSAMGLVVGVAGPWAWLSFLFAGVTAGLIGHCYAGLARRFKEGGGAFEYLREEHMPRLAGSLSWVLIGGYILTISVYAFTFAAYSGYVLGASTWVTRFISLTIIAALVWLNIVGVRSSATFEKISVWGKLLLLLLLAGVGLWRFDLAAILNTDGSGDVWGMLVMVPVGAALGFMAFEGFQLLSYDYDDIEDPERNIRWSIHVAIIVTTLLYVLVFLGAASLITSAVITSEKEIALAKAGQEGGAIFPHGDIVGLGLMTVAAVFSTGSAINATLFATARLAHRVAADGELPAKAARTNQKEIPYWSLIAIGIVSAVLAMASGLSMLVEAASLAFLITFAVIAWVAWREHIDHRWAAGLALILAVVTTTTLTWRLATHRPGALAGLGVLVLLATVGRHFLLKKMETRPQPES